jgi:plasmid replication initiation protein
LGKRKGDVPGLSMGNVMSNRRFYNPQFDLFLPAIVDLKFRDQKDIMERPFFSLSKSKRMKPIEYRNDNDGIFVTVQPHQDFGMATIWDADILIWAASMISDMKNRKMNDIPRKLTFQPHDVLKAIGRSSGGRDYQQLRDALGRLKSTIITTNIRAPRSKKQSVFSWIDQADDLIDARTKESLGMSVTLSDWFYNGVLEDGGVLAIDPAYFSITGGRERWLYRVARKHAGGNGADGFGIAMRTLFDKSGADGTYRRFKFEMQRIAERDDLPGYLLALSPGSEGEPVMHMVRRDQIPDADREAWRASVAKKSRAMPRQASKPDKAPPQAAMTPSLFSGSRMLSERCRDRIRDNFPGWDVYALKASFDEWIGADPVREPKDYDNAFYGFVKQHHQRNRHQLG